MLSEEWSRADQVFFGRFLFNWLWRYFRCSFPDFILSENLHINLCEMLTVVVALKAWGSNFSGKKIIINCDNLVTVRDKDTGASRNKFVQSCLREICFIAAINNFDIKCRHISGSENRIPDLLSRWNLHGKFEQEFLDRTRNMVICRDLFPSVYFHFSCVW